jgi:hypothetical protein
MIDVLGAPHVPFLLTVHRHVSCISPAHTFDYTFPKRPVLYIYDVWELFEPGVVV